MFDLSYAGSVLCRHAGISRLRRVARNRRHSEASSCRLHTERKLAYGISAVRKILEPGKAGPTSITLSFIAEGANFLVV